MVVKKEVLTDRAVTMMAVMTTKEAGGTRENGQIVMTDDVLFPLPYANGDKLTALAQWWCRDDHWYGGAWYWNSEVWLGFQLIILF